jgi:tetratricopeptide (TPR) repeat protein
MVALTPIQTLEAAVRDSPAIPELYVQLAELYVAAGREYDAERMLTKGQAATDDARVRTLREDITMRRLEGNVARAQQSVERKDTPEARAALADARTERDRVELEIFTGRTRRDPADARARYELGLRLKRASRLREAYEHFGHALADTIYRASAALEIGECLRDFGEFAPALKHFRLAANAANRSEHAEIKKQALWQAVGLCNRVKLQKLAQRYMNELARLDPHYGDLRPGRKAAEVDR